MGMVGEEKIIPVDQRLDVEKSATAILGVIESLHEKGVEYDKMHVIISVIEHSSVRECANHLSNLGVEAVSYTHLTLPTNREV